MSAIISECGQYRYVLGRGPWREPDLRLTSSFGLVLGVLWIMLNPSTADAAIDDPTILACMSFSKAWGFGRMTVGNAYALRSTDPKAIRRHPDPIGPENDVTLAKLAMSADMAGSRVVVAWGAHIDPERERAVAQTWLRPDAVLPRHDEGRPPASPALREAQHAACAVGGRMKMCKRFLQRVRDNLAWRSVKWFDCDVDAALRYRRFIAANGRDGYAA